MFFLRVSYSQSSGISLRLLTRLAAPLAFALSVGGTAAQAQHTGHGSHGAALQAPASGQAAQPYSGFQAREIKALSPQQVADLRAGRGMSLALPAELNGYPGPMHVLELAQPLALTPAQRERTQQLMAQMRTEAQAQGERVIEAERALDASFRSGQAASNQVTQMNGLVATAAQAQGELRAVHLRYHLAMVQLLSPQQVDIYKKLRGYR